MGLSNEQVPASGAERRMPAPDPIARDYLLLALRLGRLLPGVVDAYFGPADLTVQSNDLGNTGLGGAQVTTNIVSISVDFINTAPILAGANDLSTINEDQAGNAGTLVSAPEPSSSAYS